MDWAPIFASAGTLVATLGGSYFLFRGKRVEQETEETKTETAAASAFLQGQASFQQYVDGVVERRVNAAVEPFQKKLTELETRLEQVQSESHEMQAEFRSWVVGVWRWDVRGRAGDIPMPPIPVLTRLGLVQFADDWPTEPPLKKENPS